MILQIIMAAFVLGTTSSLHCVGMCGPLAMALPVSRSGKAGAAFTFGLYHSGRIFTYVGIGVLLGITARGISISGMQQWVSIGLGLIVISVSLYGILFRKNLKAPGFIKSAQQRLTTLMVGLLNKPSGLSYFFLGICNGLLPCGMVYIAIAGALSLGDILQAALFMSFFGIGTLPALLSLSIFGLKFKAETRMIFKQVSPYLMMFVGIILLCRGLNLGIPLLSPKLISLPVSPISCH